MISRFVAITLFAVCFGTASAQTLEIVNESPKVKVVIPDLETKEIGPHPGAGSNPAAKLMGQAKDGTTFSLLTPTTDRSTTSSQCAGWLAGTVLSRFAPDLAKLKIVPAGDNAFVVLYPFEPGPVVQLKAHVVSGNGAGHCVEVHISRTLIEKPSEEVIKRWMDGFKSVRVSY